MIVDCALYREGKRTDESRSLPRLAAQARADSDSFVWMGLFEPSPTDLTGVARLFGIHPLAVEDAVKAHQRPKLDVYDNLLFLVLRTVWFDPEAESVSTGELMVLLGEHFVLTVRHGEGGSLENVRHTLEHGDALHRYGPAAVLHAICDAVADRYLEVAEQVEDVVEQVELDVFGDDKADDSARIYRLKREVHEFRRAVVPLVEPSSRLAADDSVPFVHPDLRPFFNDVSDHVLRASEQVESYDRQLSDIVQAHLSQVAVRQ
ncbi:MAG TPA: magnesium and cobalt transport protein CorA, partial [Motilibacteraceae bacterium]|nr:magnesium and cobalt transport protein CorA [Motilibacteraceae bacterium]